MGVSCGHASTGAASPAAQLLTEPALQQTLRTSPTHPGGGDSATMATCCTPQLGRHTHLNGLPTLLPSEWGQSEVARELPHGAEHR